MIQIAHLINVHLTFLIIDLIRKTVGIILFITLEMLNYPGLNNIFSKSLFSFSNIILVRFLV